MSEYRLRPAERGDMEHVAYRLRPEHIREAALLGLDGVDALRHSFDYATTCLAFLADDEPLFLAGAMEPESLGGAALAWMAGTREMDYFPYPILEASPWILSRLHAGSGAVRLENHVPADYAKGVKFARWLGCKLGAESVRRGVRHIHIYHDLPGDESI